jgi:hypothetical protein
MSRGCRLKKSGGLNVMSKPSEYEQYTEHLLQEEERYNDAIRQYYAREKSAGLKVPAWLFIAAGAAVALAVGYCAAVWMGLL